MSLFPSITSGAATSAAKSGLPLAKEVKWDFAENVPVFRAGEPAYVTGKDAVAVWIWKTLHTRRFRHAIYTFSYGCDAPDLIGQAYTEQLKTTEAARYVRECLVVNQYVTAVRDIEVDFSGSALRISCTVDTIYGEVDVSV